MFEKLKPCSHCEGIGSVAYDGWSESGAWACVQCQTCKICTESCLDISEAIAAWNHRPIEDKLQARIDALEWLREVEKANRLIDRWYPDLSNRGKEASRRRSDARAELRRMWWEAREAVES